MRAHPILCAIVIPRDPCVTNVSPPWLGLLVVASVQVLDVTVCWLLKGGVALCICMLQHVRCAGRLAGLRNRRTDTAHVVSASAGASAGNAACSVQCRGPCNATTLGPCLRGGIVLSPKPDARPPCNMTVLGRAVSTDTPGAFATSSTSQTRATFWPRPKSSPLQNIY